MFSYTPIVHRPDRDTQATPVVRRLAGLFVCLAMAGLLVGCEALPAGRPDADTRYTETRAGRLERAGRHAQAAELYEQAAAASTDPDRLWLRAAGQWHAAGNWADVLRVLQRISGPLAANDQLQHTLLGASAALSLGDENLASSWLERMPQPTPDNARPALLWLQIRLALLQGQTQRAVELNVEREVWLARSEDVLAGRRALLDALGKQEFPDAAPDEADTSPHAGWLALARIVSQADRDPFVVRSSLRKWQERFPDHPAVVLLPELADEYRQLLDYPQRLAILLPASGRLGPAGAAVRDGLMAAYLRHDESRPELRFYDTNAQDAADVYARAVLDGADFVIGPLTRDAVSTLAGSVTLPVPTLALNNVTGDAMIPGIYQFGLTPEDEARQAARRVLNDGLIQGVALVPASEWGGRMLTAFRDELSVAGGMLLDYQDYAPREDDFSQPITTVLHLAESRGRHRALVDVLGRRIEFEPRRRQDVQFIFLAATPDIGRLMRPQLRFHYASSLPVYATSAIYEQNPDRNGDLNGVSFTDIPWLIDDAPEIVAMREEVTRLFPGNMRSWPRLYALGFDAYRLVPALFSGKLLEEQTINGLTGELSLNRDGQVRRKLKWARFEAGIPVLLEEPATLPGPGDGPAP